MTKPIIPVLFNGLVDVSAAPVVASQRFGDIPIVLRNQAAEHFTCCVSGLIDIIGIDPVPFSGCRHELEHASGAA
ncbi:hypothetical protein D3C74_321350 [compost metagenome]